MTLAAGLFFITPALQNLDVAFQGLNTWHSFQYLAVVIFLNRYRQAHGMIGSASGRPLRLPRLGHVRRRHRDDGCLRRASTSLCAASCC